MEAKLNLAGKHGQLSLDLRSLQAYLLQRIRCWSLTQLLYASVAAVLLGQRSLHSKPTEYQTTKCQDSWLGQKGSTCWFTNI